MKRRTWLRLNTVADRNMDDGLKKVHEREDTKRRMQANTNHELGMIKQQQKAEAPLFKDIDPYSGSDWNENRMDIIGQNGNDGQHYDDPVDGRWNWYGAEEEDDVKDTPKDKEPDATGMEEDPPASPKIVRNKRGNYEI